MYPVLRHICTHTVLYLVFLCSMFHWTIAEGLETRAEHYHLNHEQGEADCSDTHGGKTAAPMIPRYFKITILNFLCYCCYDTKIPGSRNAHIVLNMCPNQSGSYMWVFGRSKHSSLMLCHGLVWHGTSNLIMSISFLSTFSFIYI